MNTTIFINYRRDDTAPYAGRLYDRLTEHFGEDQVFMDIDHIEPGEDFVEVINRKIASCDIAIVAIGPNWLRATDTSGKRRLDDEEDFVRMEIVAVLQRKIRVIPVLVGGARMPGRQDLPEALAPLSRRNAIELSETRFRADVNKLIEAIEKSLKEPQVWTRKRLIIVSAIVFLLLALAGVLMWSNLKRTGPGNASAQFDLGRRYQSGESGPRDLGKAKDLYQKAADQGYAPAQYNLGWLYEHGEGVPKDLGKARQLYQKAANQGHARAQANLGWLCDPRNGEDGPKDLGKAIELYQEAGNRGDALAQNNLGTLYETGEGVPKDLGKARQLYQKAANQGGYALAQNNLGRLYETGEGVLKDLGKAADLYQQAAYQEDPRGQFNLGRLYETGEGVPKDLGKARDFYQAAAAQDWEPAITQLKALSRKSSPTPEPTVPPLIPHQPLTLVASIWKAELYQNPTMLATKEFSSGRGPGVSPTSLKEFAEWVSDQLELTARQGAPVRIGVEKFTGPDKLTGRVCNELKANRLIQIVEPVMLETVRKDGIDYIISGKVKPKTP